MDRAKRRRKVSASISSIVFIWFDRFLSFLFSWVIQQLCFHDVKCCFLDARGASFLTSRNENYSASVAFKFARFPRGIRSTSFTERVNRRRSFLEYFREVSRAVNLVTYFFWPVSTWKCMAGSIGIESRNAKPILYLRFSGGNIYAFDPELWPNILIP